MGEIRQSVVIEGLKGSKRVNALLDSGAQTSILRKSIAVAIEPGRKAFVKVIASNGEEEVGYPIQILVKILNRIAKANVIVITKTTEDLILGQDFLQLNDVLLDFERDKIILNKTQPRVRRVVRF